jgi:peroxiredoxin Q/BCP
VVKKAKSAKKSAKKKPAKKVAKKAAKKKAPKKSAAKKSAKKVAKAVAVVAGAAATAAGASKIASAVSNKAHPLLGAPAPTLTVQNQNGQEVNVAEAVKSAPKVVLYFYPKDDTPGCTAQACSFRDNLNRLESEGVKVFGVSPDSPESHQKFIEKYGLNFDLLSDTNHELSNAFKVWKEKSFMGHTSMGVERSTFVFNNGQVAKAWQPVKVEGHVDDVLKSLNEI